MLPKEIFKKAYNFPFCLLLSGKFKRQKNYISYKVDESWQT